MIEKIIQKISQTIKTSVAGIPHRYIVGAGRLTGILLYILAIPHRRIVKRNLRFAQPDWSADYIRNLSVKIFQNIGITLLEICQMTCFSKEDISHRVRIKGEENLVAAMKNPTGLILITAHLGNWEMSHLFFSCYFKKPLVIIARKIQPEILDRWIGNIRKFFDSDIIDKKGALPEMGKALKMGNPLGVLIDQGPIRSEGVKVSFFGKTVTATPAVALLARRYKCPVLPGFCIREKDLSLTLIIKPPLSLKKTGDLRVDLRENTQIMTDAIEKAVKEYPEQWFWLHKRWKRYYPDLYPEYQARRKRRRKRKKLKMTK